jgi:hypothetical protein
LDGAPDEVEPAGLPTLFFGGPLSDVAFDGIGAVTLEGAAPARASVGVEGPLATSVGVLLAETAPAGASPVALGVVAAGWPTTLIAAANPPSGLSPATGDAAPSLGRVVDAVESTAEAAIMGRQSVSGRRRLLRQNIRPAQATAAPIATCRLNH